MVQEKKLNLHDGYELMDSLNRAYRHAEITQAES